MAKHVDKGKTSLNYRTDSTAVRVSVRLEVIMVRVVPHIQSLMVVDVHSRLLVVTSEKPFHNLLPQQHLQPRFKHARMVLQLVKSVDPEVSSFRDPQDSIVVKVNVKPEAIMGKVAHHLQHWTVISVY